MPVEEKEEKQKEVLVLRLEGGWCNNCGSAQTMQCHTFGAGGSDDGNVSDDAGGDGYDDDVDDGSGSSSTMLKLSLKLRLCQSEFSLGSFYLKVRNHSYADKTKQWLSFI